MPMELPTDLSTDLPTELQSALKEWAVAVSALLKGETILLLRKGGIREEGGRFRVAQQRVWLYPTYEHQQPLLLKPAYAEQVTPVASGWHPETVPIQGWADITHIMQISDAETVSALLPFHVWNQQFVTERFNWKPRQPLYLLLLRVYRLAANYDISYRSEYGGCKSWIELAEPLSTAIVTPVLNDAEYRQRVNAIQHIVDASPQSTDHGLNKTR